MTAPPAGANSGAAAAGAVSLWLLLRAFASGCTAMTGVEAVSNGVPAFAEPRQKRAQQTLTVIVVILGVLLAGIAYLAHAYHILAMDQEKSGYQSVISQMVSAVVGRGIAYYVTIGSTLAVLCLSANTSFADFPRLCRLLAEDRFLPSSFAHKGRRLVFTTDILLLAILSGIILTIFGGITDRLIPLFAIGAFLAFTLSQAGMVAHWRRELEGGKKDKSARSARLSLVINALGCGSTAIALGIILVAKFREGAWITVLLIGGLMWLFKGIHRHYRKIRQEIACDRPIEMDERQPPLVVVPVSGWNTITEKALQFAYRISDDIAAIHVGVSAGDDPSDDSDTTEEKLREEWAKFVEEPLKKAGVRPPPLTILPSPYRLVFGPLLRFLKRQEKEHPDRPIVVMIPELVEARWWHYPLHNQIATALKAALLFHGGNRVSVMNVPWYAGKDGGGCGR